MSACRWFDHLGLYLWGVFIGWCVWGWPLRRLKRDIRKFTDEWDAVTKPR